MTMSDETVSVDPFDLFEPVLLQSDEVKGESPLNDTDPDYLMLHKLRQYKVALAMPIWSDKKGLFGSSLTAHTSYILLQGDFGRVDLKVPSHGTESPSTFFYPVSVSIIKGMLNKVCLQGEEIPYFSKYSYHLKHDFGHVSNKLMATSIEHAFSEEAGIRSDQFSRQGSLVFENPRALSRCARCGRWICMHRKLIQYVSADRDVLLRAGYAINLDPDSVRDLYRDAVMHVYSQLWDASRRVEAVMPSLFAGVVEGTDVWGELRSACERGDWFRAWSELSLRTESRLDEGGIEVFVQYICKAAASRSELTPCLALRDIVLSGVEDFSKRAAGKEFGAAVDEWLMRHAQQAAARKGGTMAVVNYSKPGSPNASRVDVGGLVFDNEVVPGPKAPDQPVMHQNVLRRRQGGELRPNANGDAYPEDDVPMFTRVRGLGQRREMDGLEVVSAVHRVQAEEAVTSLAIGAIPGADVPDSRGTKGDMVDALMLTLEAGELRFPRSGTPARVADLRGQVAPSTPRDEE